MVKRMETSLPNGGDEESAVAVVVVIKEKELQ
jgi:hypothetical protein